MKWYHWPLIVVLVAGFIFGIMQPFIWQLMFDKDPPKGAVDLSVLLSLVLAMVGLGTSAFVLLAYRYLEDRLRKSLGEEIVTESRSALARALGNLAFSSWRTWLINPKDLDLIRGTISTQSWSLDLVEKLKPTYILPEDIRLQMKSNICGYTAYIGKNFTGELKAEDIEKARKMGREAYEKAKHFGDKYDWKANYAGFLAIFGTLEEKQLAKKIKEELQQRVTTGEISEREWQEYSNLLVNL